MARPTEFNQAALSEGRLARLDGFVAYKANPYERGTLLWWSFNEGWMQVNNDPDAPKAEVRE